MRVAICGAGSAGFYSASRPFALDQQATCTGPIEISIDLSMRLPSSFGLSRCGVAPDHPEVKVCLSLSLIPVTSGPEKLKSLNILGFIIWGTRLYSEKTQKNLHQIIEHRSD
ncbi:hypothetical protein Pst134EB_030978 [Puccinia striiformis f. sp. tritici]|nr:hypothetical protein Pst134EB_030978 [Puccinia striiformis f. sp. tritici]